jgi:CSLREA domain-containing protein
MLSTRGFRRERARRIAAEARRAELRRHRGGLVAGVAAGAFALAAPAAQAANFEVNTLTDAAANGCTTAPAGCTLRDAITDAGANSQADVITFQSGLSGTLTLTQGELQTSQAVPPDNVSIQGPGGGAITISGDADGNGPDAGDSRILYVREPSSGGTGTSVAISGLILTGGFPASNPGGAIYLGKYTHLTVDNTTITGNTSPLSGGAIGSAFPKYTEISIADSTISGNSSVGGGGISTFGPLTIDHSTLSDNHATGGAGGAIAFGQKYGPLTVADSVFTGNAAANGGGAISSNPVTGGPLAYGPTNNKVSGTTLAGNNANVQGGALAVYGLASDQGSFTIDHSTISGNHATNTTSYGGGVAAQGTFNGKLSVVDSTANGNGAGAGGGIGIRSQSQVGPNGSISADNSTIASNTATYEGGGMWVGKTGPGGGPYVSPPVGVNSTVVGDNTAGISPAPNDLGRDDLATSGGFQLSFSLVEAPTDAVDTQASSITGTDPQLGALGNNGGPTQTELPSATSPALDAGNNPLALTTDQRGDPRTVDQSGPNAADGTDIGAVERALPPPPAPPATKKKCKKHKHKKRSADSAKKHKKCKKKKKKRH